jgi:hypothetical protein
VYFFSKRKKENKGQFKILYGSNKDECLWFFFEAKDFMILNIFKKKVKV